MPGPLYLAYGANMNGSLLAHRLGRENAGTFARRRGVLRGYRLVFAKVSSRDPEIGYGSVVPEAGCEVEGVLNALTEAELTQLDAIELVPRHYVRRVMCVYEPTIGAEVEAHLYIASPNRCRHGLVPVGSYLRRMAEGGDLLSRDYLQMLAELSCLDDASIDGDDLLGSALARRALTSCAGRAACRARADPSATRPSRPSRTLRCGPCAHADGAGAR